MTDHVVDKLHENNKCFLHCLTVMINLSARHLLPRATENRLNGTDIIFVRSANLSEQDSKNTTTYF